MWRRYGDCASTAVHHACCTTADARRALSSCSRRTPACVTGVTTGRGRWRRARGDKPADRTPTSAADLGGGPCRERARKCSKDVGNAERSRARGAQQPLPRSSFVSVAAHSDAVRVTRRQRDYPRPASARHVGSYTTASSAGCAAGCALSLSGPRALSDEQAEPDDGLMGGEAKDARATLVALAAAFALSHHDIRRACVWWLNPPAATP